MNNIKSVVSKCIAIIGLISFGWAIVSLLFFPRIHGIYGLYRMSKPTSTIILLNVLSMCAVVFIYFFFYKIYKKKYFNNLSMKQTMAALIVVTFIFICLYILIINYFQVIRVVDDSQSVYKIAKDLYLNKAVDTSYLYVYPQNLFLLRFYIFVFSIFGPSAMSLVYSFLAIYVLSVFVTFFTLKNLNVSNCIALILSTSMYVWVQAVFHISVAYTDILLIFFLDLCLFFLSLYFKKQQIIWLVATSIMILLAFLSKGTALIFFIAVVMFLLIFNKKQQKIHFLIPIAIFLIGNFAWNYSVSNSKLFSDDNYGMPNTSWILLGSSDNYTDGSNENWRLIGVYNDKDFAYSEHLMMGKHLNKKEIEKKQMNVVKNRLIKLSAKEWLNFLNLKIAGTWSSGDIKSTADFSSSLDTRGWKRFFDFTHGKKGLILYMIMQIIQLSVYSAMLLGFVKLFRRNGDGLYALISLYSIGYFAFLLIWEANPRYSLGIFPIAILLLAYISMKEKNLDTKSH
ncbi:glycosyltransferase family 39 protein [Paucilactobacillus nenjiangensis]|uniref:glycosyltransferase family 39 protein n=1 Tax=Paucilactobacillus nenjiangensis TaxID=1296540 RepID=UPI0028D8E274|nr:glycosyltransferase family 39 protein [Paucilactobacillus nenjiangensis]